MPNDIEVTFRQRENYKVNFKKCTISFISKFETGFHFHVFSESSSNMNNNLIIIIMNEWNEIFLQVFLVLLMLLYHKIGVKYHNPTSEESGTSFGINNGLIQ